MKKKVLSIFIALVLVLSLSLVTAVPVAAAAVTVPDRETAITSTADRLVALQSTASLGLLDPPDYGWDWKVTDLIEHSVEPSADNLYGVTALGLIDAHEVTEVQSYLDAAGLVADMMIGYGTDYEGFKTDGFGHSFDLRFLMSYAEASGNTTYSDFAKNYWAWVKAREAPNVYADGSQEDFYQYYTFISHGFAAWGAGDFGLAALEMGDTAWASDMAQVVSSHLSEISAEAERFIGWGHALELLNAVDSTTYATEIASLIDSLTTSQNADGSWGTGENTEGYAQDAAYAIMGLAAVGEESAAQAGADWLVANQGYDTIEGGWNNSTDNKEYSETDSEALQALASVPAPVTIVDKGYYSIQSAIDSASTDDTISVAAGTYNEVVTIDKSLTLNGAKAGQDARTRTFTDESVLDGTGLTAVVGVGAFNILDGVSNVIIDGFEVCDYESANDGGGSAVLAYSYGATQTQGLSNITIQNNYLHDVGWNGVCVWSNNGVVQDNFTIQFNLIEEAPYAGIELTNATNSQVLNNKVIAPTSIVNDPGDAGVGIEIAARAQPGISMSAGNVLVEGNEITGAFPMGSRAGINLLSRTYASDSDAALTGVTVRGNTVSGVTNIWAAILAVPESRDGGPATITNLAVEDNILVGNSWAGICVEQRGGTFDSITVSGNTLENNLVHVYDSREDVLDIQGVLENNTFDRTVVIDHLGQGSLHHWIFGSIAEAVGSAYDGDTVLASAGTYDEQVVIYRAITLQGAGDTTVIKPSSESKLTYSMGLNAQPGALFNNHSVAGIVNAKYTLAPGPVIIKDLMVDGGNIDAALPIADYIAGIFGLGMNGIIDNVTVVNMGTSTEQPRTYGMWLDSVIWDASVEVKNCTITGYNKNGINARGALQNVDIHDNTITGGPSDIQVPNGVMLLNGVTGEVNNNIISNMAYTPETWFSIGIMFYESSGSVSGNTITDCQTGVLYQDGGGTAQGNTVNGGTVGLVGLWAQYLVSGAWDVSFVENTVSVANDDTCYPLENAAIGVQTVDAGAFINATIHGNQVTGNEGTSADGIIIGDFSQPGNITATITNNTVSGWQHGIRLVSSVAAGTTITGNNITNNISLASGIHIEAGVDATSVSVNFNDIVGNQGYGVYNGGRGTLNATTNWWGDATGPYNLTTNLGGLGNAASDNVTFSPWLYPSTVVTAAASSLSTTSATLNGSLDDLGSTLSVDVSFEWGRTTAYGDTTAVVSVGQTGDFSATISGLSPSTTYHFRVKAMGDGPDVYGDDITFTTKAVAAPAPTYYTETSLFGTEETFRISSSGKILETIEATSADGNLTITIPKDTVALDKDGKRLASLETAVNESPPDPPADANIIGLAYDFGPDGATFDPAITLEYTYDPEALPEGVAEEDLVIAYYDEEAGEWVELDCVVDTVNNIITASVPHFTTFAIIGTVPPVPPPPPPAPARFIFSSLGVSPSEVAPGEEVNISVLVANTGGESGSYTVVLKIDGVKEAEERVTIAASRSQTVTFSVTKEEADTYAVTVDGLSDSFTVVSVVVPPEPAAFSVSYLSFSQLEVEPGEAVTITVLVANIGGESGSYAVVLKIDGVKEAEETVTLAAGDSQDVSFSATREEPGNYTVTVDGWSGSFTVLLLVEPPGFNWPLYGGIIGGVVVVGLLVFFFIRRRAY